MDAQEALRLLEEEKARGIALIDRAETPEDLESIRSDLLGRRSRWSQIQKSLGGLPDADRRSIGQASNTTKTELERALSEREGSLRSVAGEELLRADRLDMTLPGRRPRAGSLHPLSIVERELVEVFTRLGFRVAEGPEVEDDWHNFQALNIPPDHPARTMKDSLYVSVPGHPELLLRTETSAVQIRTMQTQPPPVCVVVPGRVYRRETPDATHSPVFHQLEGLVVDEGITFADLKGTLEAAMKAMFGQDRRVRLSPAYFPFVEPGAQIGVTCFRCDGVGCSVCGTGWIELLGAGMVHPVVLENCGYDSERYTGFAFGLGIDRVALLRYAIQDIRLLFDGDIRFLAQFEGVA
jgi:phenylalanyl-tRNA synthetase alpha chain